MEVTSAAAYERLIREKAPTIAQPIGRNDGSPPPKRRERPACDRCGKPSHGPMGDGHLCVDCYERQVSAWKLAQRKTEWLARSGISERHAKFSTFDDLRGQPAYESVVRKVAMLLPTLDTAAALIGTRGSGKTQIGAVAVRTKIENGHEARMVRLAALIADLTRRFGADSDADSAWVREWSRPALLVIDEIGEVVLVDTLRAKVHWLIDARYEKRRGTLLIGNVTPDDLVKAMGSSVADRINEHGFCIQCNWPSFRGAT